MPLDREADMWENSRSDKKSLRRYCVAGKICNIDADLNCAQTQSVLRLLTPCRIGRVFLSLKEGTRMVDPQDWSVQVVQPVVMTRSGNRQILLKIV